MKVVATKDNKLFILDIKLDIGRDRNENPIPIIVAEWGNYAQCYSLEEFFDEYQAVVKEDDD